MKPILFLCLIAFSTPPPGQNFLVIETSHFIIHYPEAEEDLARETAFLAEAVHHALAPRFGWIPRRKTRVVITTHTDIANGVATPFPYNCIFLYPHPPAIESFLPYRNWLLHLLIHEYAHILHLDQARGFPGFLRKIFGRIILPNAVEPLWLIEGIATHVETEFGGKGRGDHPFSRMVLHTALREDTFPPVQHFNGLPGTWPRGKGPYIYGSGFYRYLSERYGPDTPFILERSHSRMILPFWLGRNSKRILKKNYLELWREWRDSLFSDLQEGPSGDFVPLNLLTGNGDFIYGGRFSPEGDRIAFTRRSGREYPGIYLLSSRSPDVPEKIIPRNSGSTLSWMNHGEEILFDQRETNISLKIASDLYRQNLQTGRVSRLTRNRNLAYPDPSPVRDEIAAIRLRPVRSDLVLLDCEGNIRKILLPGNNKLPAIFEPRFSPDGNAIAFSAIDAGGNIDIYLLPLASREIERITSDPGDDISPTWSPDGAHLLFASSRNGRYNLYAYSLTDHSLRQITDSPNGAFAPDVSPDGSRILFSTYNASGFNLATIPFDPEHWTPRPAEPVSPEPPAAGPVPAPVATSPPSRYSPLSTLLPRFWIPFLSFSTADREIAGIRIGAITGSQDAVGRHLYILNPFYHSGGGRPGGWFFYENRSWYPRISVSASLDYLPHVWEEQNDRTTSWIQSENASASITLPVPSYRNRYGVRASFRGEREKSLLSLPDEAGFTESTLIGPGILFYFNSARAFSQSSGNVEGFDFLIGSRHYLTELGSTRNLDRYRVDGTFFTRLPANSAAGIRLGGGYHPSNSFGLFPRGYPESIFRGAEYAGLASLTLKSPPLIVERGIRTLPLYLNLLYFALFGDISLTGEYLDGSALRKAGIGASLVFRTTMGYAVPTSWVVTVARGVDPGGETQFYVTMNYQFGSGTNEHRRNQEILSGR